MPTDNYDVLVIGSGPGGYVTAIRAAQLGLKTALVEQGDRFGGTCLNVGCIPTKALLQNAEVYDYLKDGKDWGIQCGGVALDWAAVRARKDKIVTKHGKGVEFLLKKNKVEMLRGRARLAGGGRVDISGGDGKAPAQVAARGIILASGSEACLLPGLAVEPGRVLTNIEVLQLDHVPKSMVVVGAGAVGVEFASIFRTFGTEVTLLEMLPRIVPFEDEEVSKELERLFKKRGIKVNTSARVETVTTSEKVRVEFLVNGKTQALEAETLLVAVGRKPNTEDLGLDKTRAEVERGFVKVDEYQRTGEPGLYAIGDIVAGFPQLAHVASMQGLVAAAHLAGRPARPVRRERIPACTYTHPEIASVGLTEAQARERGHNVRTGKFPFLANSRASIIGKHDGFVKMVADAGHGELLGVHMIGPLVTELISEAVMALELEATIDEFMWTIHAHPTLSEALFEAANAVSGMTINA
jgi:dihydrolipoamide dehydrogenase